MTLLAIFLLMDQIVEIPSELAGGNDSTHCHYFPIDGNGRGQADIQALPHIRPGLQFFNHHPSFGIRSGRLPGNLFSLVTWDTRRDGAENQDVNFSAESLPSLVDRFQGRFYFLAARS